MLSTKNLHETNKVIVEYVWRDLNLSVSSFVQGVDGVSIKGS
jgi:hypothetical protein